MPRTIRHDPLSDDMDELSPEKDRTTQRRPKRIAVQEEDVDVDEERCEDSLDNDQSSSRRAHSHR